MGLAGPLWRAVAVFRIAALVYAATLIASNIGEYAHPAGGWVVLTAMAAWTGFTTWAYGDLRRRSWPLLAADLVVTIAALGASRWVVGAAEMIEGRPTLPMAWVAAPVLAWAIHGGSRAGAAAALAVGAVDLLVRGGFARPAQATLNATVLLLLAGVVMGYMSRLAAQAEQQMHRAVQLEAATRERERLARGIHDSVLQVLALVQRRGAELGGEAAMLGRLAGEQEATLRALVAGGGAAGAAPGGTGAGDAAAAGASVVDLRRLLDRYASAQVVIAAPASPVPLPPPVAAELAAAVGAALDNVKVHCGAGAPAWVLVEAEVAAVTVTVRDDGPGIAAGRLAQAAADGRLGVAQSIQGRMRELGGTAVITSAPGQGTEVELRLPLRHGSGSRQLPERPHLPERPGRRAGDGGRRSPDVA